MTDRRYADRFRDQASRNDLIADEGPTTHLDAADRAAAGRAEDLAAEEPGRAWPPWLTRTAAVVGVAAAALVAVNLGDHEAREPLADQTAQPTRSYPLNPLPLQAPVEVGPIDAELWASRGFTYDITVNNPSEDSFEVINIGPTMSGVEIAWNRDVVLGPGRRTTVRVDYLVINCLAATTSAVPDHLRLTLRRAGSTGSTVELADVSAAEPAAAIEAEGRRICSSRNPSLSQVGSQPS